MLKATSSTSELCEQCQRRYQLPDSDGAPIKCDIICISIDTVIKKIGPQFKKEEKNGQNGF